MCSRAYTKIIPIFLSVLRPIYFSKCFRGLFKGEWINKKMKWKLYRITGRKTNTQGKIMPYNGSMIRGSKNKMCTSNDNPLDQ